MNTRPFTRDMFTLKVMQKLWNNIKEVTRTLDTPCWEWQGKPDSGGYGQIWITPTNYRAHRVFYFLWFGELPDKELRHLCDNRICARPEHLVPGTRQENIDDREKRRMAEFQRKLEAEYGYTERVPDVPGAMAEQYQEQGQVEI